MVVIIVVVEGSRTTFSTSGQNERMANPWIRQRWIAPMQRTHQNSNDKQSTRCSRRSQSGFGESNRRRNDGYHLSHTHWLASITMNRFAGGYGSTLLNMLRCNTNIEFPLTLGRDFSGVVKRRGMSVREEIQIGDEVWGVVPLHRSGCHAEYVSVDEHCVSVISDQQSNSIHFDSSAFDCTDLTCTRTNHSLCGGQHSVRRSHCMVEFVCHRSNGWHSRCTDLTRRWSW